MVPRAPGPFPYAAAGSPPLVIDRDRQEVAGHCPDGEPHGPKDRGDFLRSGDDYRAETQEGDDNPGRQVAGIGDEIDLFQFRLQIFLQGVDGRLDPGMVCVFQFDGFAAGKELGGDELLVPGQGFHGALLAHQGVVAVIFFDPHPAFHRHVHHCGGKGLVVIPHAADESHPRRRKTGGRGVERDNGAAGRVPAHPVPGPEIESQEHGQPDETDGRGHIVLKEEAHTLLAGGLVHHALGPGHRHGQAFSGGQPPGGLEDNEVVVGLHGKIVALVSLVTGVGRGFEDFGPGGQLDISLGPVDGEGPAVAGDVPVELVKVLEEPQLPVDPVPDGVGVLPRT